jgi:uncharacterized membrane protein YpjA
VYLFSRDLMTINVYVIVYCVVTYYFVGTAYGYVYEKNQLVRAEMRDVS